MSLTTEGMTPADIRACTCGNDNGGWGNDWSSWIIIFLIFAIFGWGGRGIGGFGGGSGGGVTDGYVLASDFATIQRQLSDGFGAQERRTDAIINGICDLGYTQQSLANQTNMSVMQGFNSTQAQLAQCCCDTREAISGVNYNMATQANAIANQINNCCCESQRQIERGFCDTNYNLQSNTTAIVQNAHNDTDRILAKLSDMEATRQQEKIAELQNENQGLKFAASQAAQNNYLVNALNPCPIPAYTVPNPYRAYGCGCNC